MTETPSETGMGTWQVPECRLRIEYSSFILDEIRRIAVDAFFSLPRGGTEVGGILFGTGGDGNVRILAFRPMECEHAHGPSFVLSDKDKARLGAQLEQLRQDPALRAMEMVGWYHSHTRSEIFLSDLDLDIYREFFPKPWQVALVLRPNGMKPTRAAFFFREADGTIRSSASYHEFIAGAHVGPSGDFAAPKKLNGRQAVPPTAATPAPAAKPASPAAKKIIPPVQDEAAHPPAAEAHAAPDAGTPPLPPGTALLPYAGALPARRPAELNPPIEMGPAGFTLPTFLAPPEPKRSWRWLWVSLLLAIALGTTAYFSSSYWMEFLDRKAVYLHLQAFDHAGQLEIQWDREALAAQNPTGGALEIVDGPTTTTVPLDPVRARAGSFQYMRRSEMVEIHMTLRTSAGGTLEEFTSFIGQKPSYPPSADELAQQQQTAQFAAAAEKARGDLKKQELRTLELEQSLKRMRVLQRTEDERKRAENQMPANPRSAPQPTRVPGNTANNAGPTTGSPSPSNPAGTNTQAKPQPATPAPSPQPPASPPPQSERPAVPPEKPVVTAERTPVPTPATPAPVSKPPTQQKAQPPLSGSWVFSPASRSGSPFPPETVTLAMTEAYGQVRGLFVGRYRVPKNRKFNANVRFSFEGPVRPGTSKFPFTTADGMKGEIELIRLPNKQDAIEVVWYSERDQLTFDDIFFRKP